ncbi:hypothetical protein BTJ39_03360 [Izhakiella australiensis]|uniref:YnfC family lipoprotein n=1 Tax=Izhakiella australiensis TaxID=1926881 RepID=A0A1S8YPM7_9GAMM|nr:YnfC family lipoprotein [Izhakiella australiensis]OON41020.1 hypothetical protein BTJ39_03360 [Izhakiella australiensis]
MKFGFLPALALCLTFSSQAASPIQFKPAILNAALLFNHDPSTGPVKHSLQWIRSSAGELKLMTEVWYDRNGCFTRINMVDKINHTEFRIVNQNGILSSRKGQHIAGKVNQHCQITELDNESGKYNLSYNAQGLLETVRKRDSNEMTQRYEYRLGQFPVRIRDYQQQTDNVIAYPAGNPQFVDFKSALTAGKFTLWLKQSCSYQKEGNAGLCSLITAYDEDYRLGAQVAFSNHQTEYY